AGPGLTPDPEVAAMVARAQALVAPLINRVIGVASVAITRTESPAGESALGNLIADVLNQQWTGGNASVPKILKTSGLTYTWDNSLAPGFQIVEVRKNGVPIDPAATYSVTVNNFLAGGGDNFTVFKLGQNMTGGPID